MNHKPWINMKQILCHNAETCLTEPNYGNNTIYRKIKNLVNEPSNPLNHSINNHAINQPWLNPITKVNNSIHNFETNINVCSADWLFAYYVITQSVITTSKLFFKFHELFLYIHNWGADRWIIVKLASLRIGETWAASWPT